MNNYQTIYYLNKEAKRISDDRNKIEAKLLNDEDIIDEELLNMLDYKEKIQLSPWFPVYNATRDITIRNFKELDEIIEETLDDIKYETEELLEDECIGEISEDEVFLIENSIVDNQEYLKEMEHLKNELMNIQLNREKIEKTYEKLTMEEFKLNYMKNRMIEKLNISMDELQRMDNQMDSKNSEIQEEFQGAYNIAYKYLVENVNDFESLLSEKLLEANNRYMRVERVKLLKNWSDFRYKEWEYDDDWDDDDWDDDDWDDDKEE